MKNMIFKLQKRKSLLKHKEYKYMRYEEYI